MVWEDPLSVSSVTQDVRYALRTLRQSPLFAAVAVSSLALGIGANTAIFTLTDAILLRWLPVQNPQELVVLARNPSKPSTSLNYPDYRYVRDGSQSYTGLIAFWGGGRAVSFNLPGQSGASQLVAHSMGGRPDAVYRVAAFRRERSEERRVGKGCRSG